MQEVTYGINEERYHAFQIRVRGKRGDGDRWAKL